MRRRPGDRWLHRRQQLHQRRSQLGVNSVYRIELVTRHIENPHSPQAIELMSDLECGLPGLRRKVVQRAGPVEEEGHDPEPFRLAERPEQVSGRGERVVRTREQRADGLQRRSRTERHSLTADIAGLEQEFPDGCSAASPGDHDVEGTDKKQGNDRIDPAGSEAEPKQPAQREQTGDNARHHADVEDRRKQDTHPAGQPHEARSR